MDADLLRTDSEEDEHHGYTPGTSAAHYGRASSAELARLAAEKEESSARERAQLEARLKPNPTLRAHEAEYAAYMARFKAGQAAAAADPDADGKQAGRDPQATAVGRKDAARKAADEAGPGHDAAKENPAVPSMEELASRALRLHYEERLAAVAGPKGVLTASTGGAAEQAKAIMRSMLSFEGFNKKVLPREGLVDFKPMIKEASKEALDWYNPSDGGNTCLHLAVEHDSILAASALVEAGANANIRNSQKLETPLVAALKKCTAASLDVAQVLLDTGADLSLADWRGNGAVAYMSADPVYLCRLLGRGLDLDNEQILADLSSTHGYDLAGTDPKDRQAKFVAELKARGGDPPLIDAIVAELPAAAAAGGGAD